MDLPCNKFGTGRHDLEREFLLPGIFVYLQRFEDVRKDLIRLSDMRVHRHHRQSGAHRHHLQNREGANRGP